MASGHVNRINRPNTWLHRPMLQNVKKALANTEPSTHGTNAKCRSHRVMSELGGEPENIYSHGVFRIFTQRRHSLRYLASRFPSGACGKTQLHPHRRG